MNVITVTEANFADLIEQDKILVLDFWATWCGPCKSFAPVFEASAARHPDMVFGKIDVDAEQGLANGFGIRTVPTLLIIREQIMLVRESGALPGHELEKKIEYAKVIDMEDVRAEIAAQEGDRDAIDW